MTYWYTNDDAEITKYATFEPITPYCPFALQVFYNKTKKKKSKIYLIFELLYCFRLLVSIVFCDMF